ncbi:GPI ethanolamine phosphate transferase 3 [Phtheirospermum japonicum]|uniref:GPI ethanolamine phosphate transferase 3 n=1 Tax=Phtheirospermum japonicum TaxID=374723 RepID=A0A830D3F0_9LAMI|nr:GPI ethanolamine phosphate transferase 3 [Phtheirospermum japonicum]
MGTAAKQGIWAFVAFLGIMLLHGLTIFLFSRGFLLTRTELSQYSKCNDIAESPCFPPKDQNANRSCWTKPVVNRLVIIVLDALSQNQSSAKIFKAIADPPTTSLQRLKHGQSKWLTWRPGRPGHRLISSSFLSHVLDDHAGHIFGVDSNPMIGKLEQYNEIIKKVVGVLESQSGPGGLHENTMLLVMGDHGQTLNGDHGGGTAEELETTIFAFSSKKPSTPLLTRIDSSSCQLDMHGRRICVDSIQQLDFAATVSALLGIPFPFGSIGRVNPELFSLAGGTWNQEMSTNGYDQSPSEGNNWMQDYVNVLCINSWQVKKYIDVYSSLSLIGFSEKDLLHLLKYWPCHLHGVQRSLFCLENKVPWLS